MLCMFPGLNPRHIGRLSVLFQKLVIDEVDLLLQLDCGSDQILLKTDTMATVFRL